MKDKLQESDVVSQLDTHTVPKLHQQRDDQVVGLTPPPGGVPVRDEQMLHQQHQHLSNTLPSETKHKETQTGHSVCLTASKHKETQTECLQ